MHIEHGLTIFFKFHESTNSSTMPDESQISNKYPRGDHE